LSSSSSDVCTMLKELLSGHPYSSRKGATMCSSRMWLLCPRCRAKLRGGGSVALPEEEREALCFSRGMPRNLAVHRLLSKSTQKKPDLLELPAYSMRFTFSHFSLSSNATNVSCSAKGDELKIVRTNFQCRVRFCVSTDNVNRMQSEVKDVVVPGNP